MDMLHTKAMYKSLYYPLLLSNMLTYPHHTSSYTV